jgi:hypothetical protein
MGAGISYFTLPVYLPTPAPPVIPLTNTVFPPLPYENNLPTVIISPEDQAQLRKLQDNINYHNSLVQFANVWNHMRPLRGNMGYSYETTYINQHYVQMARTEQYNSNEATRILEEFKFKLNLQGIELNVIDVIDIATKTIAKVTIDSINSSNIHIVTDVLLPALPDVVPNTTQIPSGCIYDNNGTNTSTYTGNYKYATRSYTETIDFIDS